MDRQIQTKQRAATLGRTCSVVIRGRTYCYTRAYAQDFYPPWDRPGNPRLWFAWEATAGGKRRWIACGVRKQGDALKAIYDDGAK